LSLLIMLRPLGILGAGFASIFGYAATGLFLLTGIRRKTGKHVSDVILVRGSDLRRVSERFAALRSTLAAEGHQK
jgi:Na+-driven multidrug efflux pump